ncbi:MAG TPA: hypothetical protein VGI39_04105 [Polyangiaceae bacterium]
MPKLSTRTIRDGNSTTLVATREGASVPLIEVACARLTGREVKVTIRTVPSDPSLEPGEVWGTDEHLDVLAAFRGAQRTYETNRAHADALTGEHYPQVAPDEWDQLERELGKTRL